MSEATSFAELLQRSQQGDPDAMAELAEKYEHKVRIVARRLLGQAMRPYLDSVDLVQSIHRSILMGLQEEKFDVSSPEKLIALTVTMVRRKVARQWRRLQRQQRFDHENERTLPEALVVPTSPQSDPANVAQFNDQMRLLESELSEDEQKLLTMKLSGCSTAEMAEELGITGVALRVRLTRLKQRLDKAGLVDLLF